jgi:hypothetical protein
VRVSDPNDNSIPVLHEVLVPGNPGQAHPAPAPQPAPESGMPREPSFKAEPVLAPQPVLTPKQPLAAEPVLAPEATHTAEAAFAPQPGHPADHHHLKKRSRAHHAVEPPSAGVFDRVEPTTPLEAGAIVPPDIAREAAGEPQPNLDADVIAERLRGRFAGFLTGEGRSIIETRCRDVLQEHTTRLVNQITREVALTLETEMNGWVREAVEEEIARRTGSA